MRRNKIQILIDDYVDKTMHEANKDMNSVLREVNDELYQESVKMYDSLIDQFYRYKTKSYIRHGQSRFGTGTGLALYRANNIYKSTRHDDPFLNIQLDGSEINERYRYDNSSTVLDWISSGVRFPYFEAKNNDEDYNASHLNYNGKYFSYSGTINTIFGALNKDFDEISSKLFYDRWKKTKWCN